MSRCQRGIPKRKPYILTRSKRIPREHRILMRKRQKSTKQLMKTNHPVKMKKIRDNINIGILLQTACKRTTQKEE